MFSNRLLKNISKKELSSVRGYRNSKCVEEVAIELQVEMVHKMTIFKFISAYQKK